VAQSKRKTAPPANQPAPKAALEPDGLGGLDEVFDKLMARALAHGEAATALRRMLHEVVRTEMAKHPPDANRLLEAREAAELLGMSEEAVRKAAARGTLPCVHIGRRLRFRLGDLLAIKDC